MLELMLDSMIQLSSLLDPGLLFSVAVQTAQNTTIWGVDLSIESLRSRKYSIGIFVFLVISLIIFAFIIYMYWPQKGKERLKRGEKIMLGAIIMGMVFAVLFGWLQLIEGYLV